MKKALEILDELIQGNKRYSQGQLKHPHESQARRQEISHGQHPTAIVLGCSDSRVPPEIIFDQGLGDLFTIRLAGNVVDDAALGSIEYAAGHLDVSLAIVLGHKDCGAVNAALNVSNPAGHMKFFTESILEAIEKARGLEGDIVENTVAQHALLAADEIKNSKPILSELVKKQKLLVVAAIYDVETGLVELI